MYCRKAKWYGSVGSARYNVDGDALLSMLSPDSVLMIYVSIVVMIAGVMVVRSSNNRRK